ncbi:MAG TPA: MarR family transcriptional regulator [Jiangellaceae bacterium]|nr:MarR family transcriptional regulator [Jiangellaceae bacterium]
MSSISRAQRSAEAWEALFRAQVTLMRRFEANGDFAPLTAREYDVLFQLSRAPAGCMRLRDLNEALLISQPSLSRMTERLTEQGLLSRTPADDDRRGVVVGLTERGATLQRQIGRNHVRSIRRLVGEALDDDDLTALTTLTARLRQRQSDLDLEGAT